MQNEVIMVMGLPASGKSTYAQSWINKGYSHLNRDKEGGKTESLLPKLEKLLQDSKSVIIDNTHVGVDSRKSFIEMCAKHNVAIHAHYVSTPIERCLFNAATRMIKLQGKLLDVEEIKALNHPNIFTSNVLFSMKKKLQPPKTEEGFDSVQEIKIVFNQDCKYNQKALILDYDGTLRKTISGKLFPTDPKDIEILPGRKEKLQQYIEQGYRLLGVSNQSGVHKKDLSYETAKACFDKTNELLGLNIEYVFCPHASFPMTCYCRKPGSGFGAYFIEKYNLKISDSIFVGDMTSDKTFAERIGFQYFDQKDFFL
jgi:HAD superfamily hydrolase (TIGR01662 family)